MRALIAGLEWAVLLYFVLGAGFYILLDLLAIASLRRKIAVRALEDLPPVYPRFQPPVSILVPAYNEEATIVGSVHSLLQLDYPEFEIVVVNDGSGDATLEALRETFQLEVFPEAHCRRIKEAKPIRAIYHSKLHANLRVVDKEHGGRADALNVGINASRFPLFCAMDAGSVLRRESLRRMTQPFLDDPRTVAAGCAVRVANPRNVLGLVQVVEYLRVFLFGRLGWARLNAVLTISRAFGIFRKDTVVEVGGYRVAMMGDDMNLVVRLHCLLRARRQRYAIQVVADPACWIEVPGKFGLLKDQRVGWQGALAEGLHGNGELAHAGGAPGLVALPFLMVFECYGPVIESAAYLFMAAMFLLGQVSGMAFVAFLALAFSLGFLVSVIALVLEELCFHPYPRLRQLAALVGAAALENFGYRQLVMLWRLVGLTRWLRETRATRRKGSRN